MLIITEKPSVAKDFAKALACSFSASDQAYKSRDGEITIVHCVGHLFNLQQPDFYDERFKYWNQLPIIPQQFAYDINPQTKDVAKNVIQHIKNHKNDEILIATDADREGEIIARECLLASRISDYSKIKRFWVSQALTPEVILEGIKNAKPSYQYDDIAEQGFARQKADWLVGMNFTRFMTNMSGVLLTAGRVQTAILSAINNRCESIENFKSEKYYEHYGNFSDNNGNECIGIFLDENENTSFPNPLEKLNNLSGKRASLISNKTEEKKINPPQLYNLNDLQKEAFRLYGFSAERTLQIVQKLYEEYKCVSYPRTPSKVMGEDNLQLCSKTAIKLSTKYIEYLGIFSKGDYSSSNKRVFDDSKLEAHHAIIPLEPLPYNTTIEEQSIYFLILERFFLAFGPAHIYEKQTVFLDVNGSRFKIIGRKIIDNGWKTFVTINTPEEKENILDSQVLSEIDWNNLNLNTITIVPKNTKAPKYFNEASILAFMENPKSIETEGKLVGLGTAATRHTFIPKLLKSKYIEFNKKDIVITELGKAFLEGLTKSPAKLLTDISQTTKWEEQLKENPELFLENIKEYIRNSVSTPMNLKSDFAKFQTKQNYNKKRRA